MRIARNQHDADLARGNRRDVELTAVAPMNLDIVRPRRRAVVTTEAVAAGVAAELVKPGDAACGGLGAVGTDDPAGENRSIPNADRQSIDGRGETPRHFDTLAFCMTDHQGMESGAANAES